MTSSTGSSPDRDADLDQEQEAAVSAQESAIAVLAGPGSGKTRTLSHRTRHLLVNSNSPHACALLLTFTNKAAAEMKTRALRVSGLPSKRLYASTFHTFCAGVLRSHGELVGIPRDFQILDSEEQRDIAYQLPLGKKHFYDWSWYRLRMLRPPATVAGFGAKYQAAKRAQGAVDFDDLVVEVAALFAATPAVAQAYAAKYRHVLIDEFQDTNAAQFAVARALAEHAETVSVFADDDQAIFGFAGAEAENIQRFVSELGARIYPLTTNYRSGERIVAVANSLIESDSASSGRKMRSHRTGGEVKLRGFDSVQQEARDLAAELAGSIAAGAKLADHAVLVRSGYRADALVEELGSRGVPVSDWRGDTHAPRDRRLLSACLAVLKGKLYSRQVERLASMMGIEVNEDQGEMSTEQFLGSYASQPLAQGLQEVRRLAFQGATPYAVARAAQEACRAQDATLGLALDDLVEAVSRFELYDSDFTLEHLLSELALGSIGRAPTEGGGVKVASLHRTKGLQWRIVYLLGLEEGHSPDFRATEGTMSEERRLCFVGVSRAQEKLTITRSAVVKGYRKQASRFIREMRLDRHV